jgi:hypothetical protein
VFSALVVTQANLGASWKAAFYRTIGSTEGALAAVLLTPVPGEGPVGAGVALFLLASFFGYLTALHPQARFTGRSPLRRCRESTMSRKSASWTVGCTIGAGASRSKWTKRAASSLFFDSTRASIRRSWTWAIRIRRRLTAMAEDRSLYLHAQVDPELVPSLPVLAERTAQKLDAALRDLDADLAKLRAQRVTARFALDRMLPFWALVFNVKEIAQDLKQLESALSQIVCAAAPDTGAQRVEK